MECPRCGFARSPSETECPRCIQIANLVREQKQKTPETSAPASPTPGTVIAAPKRRLCLACNQIPDSDARFCKDCGAPQTVAAQSPVSLPSEDASPLPSASAPVGTTSSLYVALISIMWTLTVVQIVLFWIIRLKPPAPYVMDVPAFLIAIGLAASKDKVARANGWANLTLEAVVLALASTMAMLQYRP